jgi:hypothetical protein
MELLITRENPFADNVVKLLPWTFDTTRGDWEVGPVVPNLYKEGVVALV